MRTLQVTGNIVADAEKKVSKNGKEYISFRIANHEFNDEKGPDGKPKTVWIGVTCYNQRYFGLAQYLKKGKPVIITGDYSDRIYQTREGNCEISRDVMANAIYFVQGRSEDGQNDANKTQSAGPVVQTKMEVPKPTTAELTVPTQPSSDNDDDLPF